MGRNRGNSGDTHVLRAEHRFCLADQQGLQRAGLAAGGRHLKGAHRGSRILIIVGIILDADIIVAGIAPDIAGGFDLPAVAGGVIGGGIRAAVHGHDAPGLLHRLAAAGVAGGRAVVHLIVGGIHQVVGAAPAVIHGAHRIGAGADTLGLERLQGGGIAHLIGQHAHQIILDEHVHDDLHAIDAAAFDGSELHVARVQIGADPGLPDLHAVVFPRAAVAAQGKIAPHLPGGAAGGQRQPSGGAVQAHADRAALRKRRGRRAIQRIAAADGHIHPPRMAQRGKIHPNHAVQNVLRSRLRRQYKALPQAKSQQQCHALFQDTARISHGLWSSKRQSCNTFVTIWSIP